jgi:hypothetical protein
MVWATVICGVAGLVLAIVAELVFPLACNPCTAVFVGLVAGVLAGVFDKPLTSGNSAGKGAAAGAIANVGSLIGQMIGAAINVLLVGPAGAARIAEEFGLPATTGPGTDVGYYLGAFGGACLCALVGVALGAGLGALGGVIWYQIGGQKQQPPTDYSYDQY